MRGALTGGPKKPYDKPLFTNAVQATLVAGGPGTAIFLVALSSGATRALAPTYPCSPRA